MENFDARNYGKNTESIGNVCFWTMYDARINTAAFRNLLDELGIPVKWFREETMKGNFLEAVRTACNHFKADFKKLKDDGEVIVMALYNVDSQDHQDLILNQHTKVTFYKATEVIQIEGDPRVEEMVLFLFNDYKNSMSFNLIRSFVVSTLRDHDASLLRPSGGIYFVPAYNHSLVEKLTTLMAKCGCGIFYNMRVPNCAEEKATTVNLAKDDMANRLMEIVNFVDKAKKECTVENMLDDVDDVRALAQKYGDLLNGEVQLREIMEKCKEVESKISERMFELRETKNAKTRPVAQETGKTEEELVTV